MLAAAVEAFAARGLAGTSLREVAERIGVSHGALLHHFASKEALYAAVLAEIAGSLALLGPAPGTGDAVEELVAILEGYLDWSLQHEAYARVLLRELLDNRERAGRARRWFLQPVVERFVAVVERGQAEGVVRACDAELVVLDRVGAVAYFAAALPTLERYRGERKAGPLVARFREELREGTRRLLLRARARG